MVSTRNTISRKVLAFVLAAACMIAFTPAVAFTQSASAANVAKTAPGGVVNSIAAAKTAFGTDCVAVTGSDTDITVTLDNQTDLTLTAPITIGQNVRLTVTSKAASEADKLTASFALSTDSSLDIEGYTEVQPADASGSSSGTTAIDGTKMWEGTITVGEKATVTGGTSSAAIGGDAILVSAGTSAVTKRVGSVVVNGTVTGGKGSTSQLAGYGLDLGTSSADEVLVNVSGTGTITSSYPADYGKWNSTAFAFSAVTSSTNTAPAKTDALIPGNVLKATAAAKTGESYIVDLYRTIGTVTTKVATASSSAAGQAATATYAITANDAGATFEAKARLNTA